MTESPQHFRCVIATVVLVSGLVTSAVFSAVAPSPTSLTISGLNETKGEGQGMPTRKRQQSLRSNFKTG